MSTCCDECRAMHRTSYESVRFHALLAQTHADNAVRYARRSARWLYVAGALLLLSIACQIVVVVAR